MMNKLLPTILFVALALSACAPRGETETLLTPDAVGTTVVEIAPTAQAPTEAPTEAPTPEPTPEPRMLKSRVNTLNYRSRPDVSDDSAILGQLGYEDEAEYIGVEGDFTLVKLPDGQEVYCYSEYLVDAGETLYAYLPTEREQQRDLQTGELVYESDGVTPVTVINELVDMRLYLPEAVYEQLFATDRNITGAPLYPRAIPLMQKGTVEKLTKAYGIFKADGYTLKVYDAYRPLRVQKILYDIVQNKHWIANPATTASNHNRGCAIDMSLIIDATGEEIVTPTPVHTFSADSARDAGNWGEEATKNVEYMTEIMKQCGFNSINSEWWHYSDTEKAKYMTTDIDLGSLTMLPKQED